MHIRIQKRAALRSAALAMASVLVLGACGDDTATPEEEPEVAVMRVTVGTQTVNVNAETGAVAGGPIHLVQGAATPFAVLFLKTDGTADPLVTAETFRVEVTPATGSTVTFARTGAFAGTLVGSGSGPTSVTFGLHHVGHGHDEFGWSVPVIVDNQ